MSSMTKNEPRTITHVAFIEESSDFVPRKSLHQTKTKLNFSKQNEVYLDAFRSKFNVAWNLDSV